MGDPGWMAGDKVEARNQYDNQTRQAVITEVSTKFVHVKYTDDEHGPDADPTPQTVDYYWRQSRWRVADGQMSWRLHPLGEDGP